MAVSYWHEWHREYDDPTSELAGRLRAVRAHVDAVVAEAPNGPVTVVSICGGEGRELIGALESHPRRGDVRGRLVELDPSNAAVARGRARNAGLDGLEVVTGDASLSDAYEDVVPADLVVVSGLFGHLDDEDQVGTIEFLRQVCRPGGSVVWTFTGLVPARVPMLRRFFVARGFDESSFERVPGEKFALTVARSRYRGPLESFRAHTTFFTFGSSRRAKGGETGSA